MYKRPKKALSLTALVLLLCCLYAAALYSRYIDDRAEAVTAGAFTDVPVHSGVQEIDWRLILVNRWNAIPDDYAVTLTQLPNGQFVDERIYDALQQLLDEARDCGVQLIVISGYRTAEEQQRLMDDKISQFIAEGCSPEDAVEKAEARVASPGTSEHQLGIAVDIHAAQEGPPRSGGDAFGWLERNAFLFGFIRRYPPGKTEITGIVDEPWHYRYVGVEAAADITSEGLCLEEYLNILYP